MSSGPQPLDASPGWWFAGGWWFSKDWTFDVAGGDLSRIVEMAHVGLVEAAHYAPQMVRADVEVQYLVEGDEYGIRTDLGAYLSALVLRTSPRADIFNLATSFDTHLHPCERVSFSLAEVVANIDAMNATEIPSYSPLRPSALPLSPIIKCVAAGETLALADDARIEHFAPGVSVWLDLPGSGRLVAQIVSVDVDERVLYTSEPIGGTECYLTAVVVPDPVRVINVNEFARWRANSRGRNLTQPDFNDELYRLLYAPVDARLSSMTRAEIFEDYRANPNRISSVLDIVRMAQSAPAEVTSKLSVLPGASVEFRADGSAFEGLTTRLDVTEGASPGALAEDRLVPTTAAVREMIAEGVGDADPDARRGSCRSETTDARLQRSESWSARAIVPESVNTGSLTVPGAFHAREGLVVVESAVATANRLRVERVDCDSIRATVATADDLVAGRAAVDSLNARDIDATCSLNACDVRCARLEVAGLDVASRLAFLERRVSELTARDP